jgi:hypothetical protein
MTCLPSFGRIPDGYGLLDPLPRTAPPETCTKRARLVRMAGSGDAAYRAKAASNPMLPVAVLRELSQDLSPLVRGWVLRNPRCPREIIESMRGDNHPAIRAFVRSLLESNA